MGRGKEFRLLGVLFSATYNLLPISVKWVRNSMLHPCQSIVTMQAQWKELLGGRLCSAGRKGGGVGFPLFLVLADLDIFLAVMWLPNSNTEIDHVYLDMWNYNMLLLPPSPISAQGVNKENYLCEHGKNTINLPLIHFLHLSQLTRQGISLHSKIPSHYLFFGITARFFLENFKKP